MLFSSAAFVFAFLPVAVGVYHLLRATGRLRWAIGWLVAASIFFYGYWKVEYLPILLSSLGVNYLVGRLLKSSLLARWRKALLAAGVLFDVLLLGAFKYTDFVLENVGLVTGAEIEPLGIVLPLAISFFTFQQISYLVDAYKGHIEKHGFLEYALFVTFFPQLIAGPIVHHAEMMPQFLDPSRRAFDAGRFSTGITVFAIGLVKKAVVADTFGVWANEGYAEAASAGFVDAWQTTLSYTFQLYFDFSGYTDMAIGAALMVGIQLPLNFDSPYKAVDIQDFWRRWHMTLSRWLRNYVYIPLGGNRRGRLRTYLNLFLTFLIGGIWHGAGWTFVVWGAIHGGAVVCHRAFRQAGLSMPRALAWPLTFLVVHLGWVFFRAESFGQAADLLSAMAYLEGWGWELPPYGTLDEQLAAASAMRPLLTIPIAAAVCFWAPNSIELVTSAAGEMRQAPSRRAALATGALAALGLTYVLLSDSAEFLYFNF